ncbi:MAG: bifunctional DNA primase/polymerase [Phycisphaeraceae bacterium]|nr:bifunctional DNA primase/polymerase [Phycisphaeraceae bacterium]
MPSDLRAPVSTRPHALEAAKALVVRGFAVIPVPARSKRPVLDGWPGLRIAPEQLDEHFADPSMNIGILLGEPSGGVVDIDLDDPLAVELADQYLAPTGAVFGRESRPRSHRLYRVTGRASRRTWKFPPQPRGTGSAAGEAAAAAAAGPPVPVPWGSMIVELRGDGQQTIGPGSVHPSGEQVKWDEDGEPAEVEAPVLEAGAAALARAVLVRRGIEPSTTGPGRLQDDPVKRVLTRLRNVREAPSGWTACCPSHDDQSPSLSVGIGEGGRVLVHCHAGCTAEQVVKAAGLEMVDLFSSKRLRRATRSREGSAGGKRPEGSGNAAATSVASPSEPAVKPPSQSERLVELVMKATGLELFRTPNDEVFATVPNGEHLETWPIASQQLRHWIAARAYREAGLTPSKVCLADVECTLTGMARFGGAVHLVHCRLGRYAGGAVYLDLGDSRWRVVRIEASGWQVIEASKCPIRFTRITGMQPLPEPVQGGSINELRPLLNLATDDQWTLLVGWMISAMRPTGPYALLVVTGEAGSAKSTLCRLVRRLIDPNQADARRPPREERDLFIAARNGWILSYNNLDGLPPGMSDALCTILSEGGYAIRTNHTDTEETIFHAQCPVIVNGIMNPASRSDLLDRSICIPLSRMVDTQRQCDRVIGERFERIRPRVLGALLDGVSAAIRNESTVVLPSRPRLADVVEWVTAAEPGLGWEPGRFLKALQRNRSDLHEDAIEGSVIGPGILRLVRSGSWRGTAKELLLALRIESSDMRLARDGPRDGAGMTRALQLLAPSLREAGVEVVMPIRAVGHDKRRVITLTALDSQRAAHAAADPSGA